MPATLGVCSWSLHPASPAELVDRVRACGLSAVQLALDPIRSGAWSEIETVNRLAAADISILSGMIATIGEDYSTLESIKHTGGVRPDQHWYANLAAAKASARLARRLGLRLVTLHAGFLPHESDSPVRRAMIDRLRQLIDLFDDHAVRLAFETGQESAETLLAALADLDRPHAGVNFDPANMILYGMGDPVAALAELAPRVVQVHVKDARPSTEPGQWGTEVPAGTGGVDWPGFFHQLRAASGSATAGPEGPLAVNCLIEREAGEQRIADIHSARILVARHMSP